MAIPDVEELQPGRSVGPTSEFSLYFRVKPGAGPSLRTALLDLQNTPGYRPCDYGTTIHKARFVLFDDDARLAFVTSFDGPWDAYLEDFLTSGPMLALFDVIFRHVEGNDGLRDLAAVQRFVLGAERSAAAYARNYPGTTEGEVFAVLTTARQHVNRKLRVLTADIVCTGDVSDLPL